MAFRSKFAFVGLVSLVAALGSAKDFAGSDRIMGVLLTHLDKAQAAVDRGDVQTAIAYTQSVLMDREEKVFLDTSGVSGSTAQTCEKAFRAGETMWLDSVPDAVRLVYVDSAAKADLVVCFAPNVMSEGMNVAGNIQWSRTIATECDGKIRASVSAVIQVRTELPGRSRDMSFELMRHTCAHEIGHFIGMRDSYRIGDLMGPLDLRSPVSHPSDSELQALHMARNEALRVRGEAALSQLVVRIH